MSYSIVGICGRSGRLGIGIASYTMAVGAYCDGAVRPNVGATITQDIPLQRNNRLAINALVPKDLVDVLQGVIVLAVAAAAAAARRARATRGGAAA